ncbi:MAG: hypothetical protein K8F30_05700 [Taibaiella sp.]|nr:hypothetical protein [Taibaiella sp.]
MSKLSKTVSMDGLSNAQIRQQLDRVFIKETQTKLEHILCETAELCIPFIAQDIRDEYCTVEKLAVVPPNAVHPIKAKAASIFIKHNQQLNRKISLHYQLRKHGYVEGE